jgi:AcrR family transcriptional regulator
MKSDAREQILHATVNLLMENKQIADITARDIAAAANVQVSMINYYYKSKDELMYQAMRVVIDKMACGKVSAKKKMSAYTRLREILIDLCEVSVKYASQMMFVVEYELVKAEIAAPQNILPIIHEICGDTRSEISMRVTAYEIISTLQLMFFRAKDLRAFLGMDILEYEHMVEIIDAILAEHFPNQEKK